MTDDELVVEFALTRIDHPGLELEDIAGLLVRRLGREQMLELAVRNLGERDELRGSPFDAAVECVVRIMLRMRGDPDR